jgi:hypothetical protein
VGHDFGTHLDYSGSLIKRSYGHQRAVSFGTVFWYNKNIEFLKEYDKP